MATQKLRMTMAIEFQPMENKKEYGIECVWTFTEGLDFFLICIEFKI